MKFSLFVNSSFWGFLLLFQSMNAQNLERFYQNGKCGYRNIFTKETIISPSYDAGSDFKEGFALVVMHNKRGFIDSAGKIAIPLIYEDAGLFEQGIARACLNNKYGFIDKKGNTLIPFEYDFADDFSEEKSRVKFNGKFGFINRKGEWAIKPIYDNVRNFSEGFAAVKTEKWGYINAQGEILIDFLYDQPSLFKNGTATVYLNHEQWLINTRNEKIKKIERRKEPWEKD